MNRFEDTLKKALHLVEPTQIEEKEVQRIADDLRRRVEEASRDEKAVHSVELGGSYAKETWLKGDVDIDIFVKFSPKISKKQLEEVGVRIGQKALAPHRPFLRYSEHPYVEGLIDGIRVNVVACYDIEEGAWKSAADRSPYHTRLIRARFDDRLKREARLLKKFMKGVGLYGAEIKIQGFSGYVCEVLVLKYGSFRAVLEAASSFREGEVISVDEVGEEVHNKFKTSIVILDPVDSLRNLGAAISPDKVAALILASRTFLHEPSVSFFKVEPVKNLYGQLKRSPLLTNLLIAIFRHKPRTIDILWGQLKRSEHHLAKQLSKAGFNVLRSSSASDEDSSSGFIFLLDSQSLPTSQIKLGPKVDMIEDASKFLSRNRGRMKLMWVGRDLRIYALGERRYWKAENMLRALLGGAAAGSGVAPGLKRDVEESFEVFSGEEILRAAAGREWLVEGLFKVVATDEFSFGSG